MNYFASLADSFVEMNAVRAVKNSKVIDKSEADIKAAIETIQSSDIPNGKDFAISCIRLANFA